MRIIPSFFERIWVETRVGDLGPDAPDVQRRFEQLVDRRQRLAGARQVEPFACRTSSAVRTGSPTKSTNIGTFLI